MPNWKKLVVSGSNASLSYLNIPGPAINDLTASVAITALNTYNSTALNSGTVERFASASATWNILHNLEELWPMVTIWEEKPDFTYTMVVPDNIISVDSNTVQVTFTQPVKGYANVSRAGHVVSGSLPWTNLIGAANVTASLNINGNIVVDGGITGSLFGSSSYSISSSNNISSSYSQTSSYVLPLKQKVVITGSLAISQSLIQYSNIAYLTGEVPADVATFPTDSFTAGFFDYVATNGANARAGTVLTVWNGSNISYTDTSTNDIGSTAELTITPTLSGGNIVLEALSVTDGWSIKTLTRLL